MTGACAADWLCTTRLLAGGANQQGKLHSAYGGGGFAGGGGKGGGGGLASCCSRRCCSAAAVVPSAVFGVRVWTGVSAVESRLVRPLAALVRLACVAVCHGVQSNPLILCTGTHNRGSAGQSTTNSSATEGGRHTADPLHACNHASHLVCWPLELSR